MAGIGVRLNRIFSKNTITTSMFGFGYSMVITVAPMFLVIMAIMVMQYFLGFSKLGYSERELYACTVLYIFIFPFLLHLRLMLSYQNICPLLFTGSYMKISFRVIMSG